jgi:molecular chaperone GrpE
MRRSATERTEAVRFANSDIMRAVIPVLDDLDRAIEAASAKQVASLDRALLDGVKLVRENLLKALREQGLEIIESTGRPFDPHVHEAMMQQPSDEYPAGTVAAELAKGYRLRERTLRPAKVIVSQGPGSEA